MVESKITIGRHADYIVQQIQDQGFCVLENVLGGHLAKARFDIHRYWEGEGQKRVIDEPYLKTGLLLLRHLQHYPAIDLLKRTPHFREVAARFFGEPFTYPVKMYATRSYPGSDVKRLPYAWHIDEVEFLKFFFYLTDVRKHGGAIEVIPKTHIQNREFREKKIASGAKWDEIPRERPVTGPMERLLAPPGSLIVFTTDLTHRAGALNGLNQFRDAFQILAARDRILDWRQYQEGDR